MKRVLVLLICILLCFSFAGCGVIKRPLKSPSGSADKSNTTEGNPPDTGSKKDLDNASAGKTEDKTNPGSDSSKSESTNGKMIIDGTAIADGRIYAKITDTNAEFSLLCAMAGLGAIIVPDTRGKRITVYLNDNTFIFDLTKENLGWDIDTSRTDAVLRYDSYYDDIIIDGETAHGILDKIGATYMVDRIKSEIRINGARVAKLFVNGTEINSGEFSKVNLVNTELPILLIMQNLGATVDIDDAQGVITVTYGEKVFKFDLAQKNFGWSIKPGTLLPVRKFDGKEIVLDGDSASDIFRDIGAFFSVDREKNEIHIAVATTEPHLFINGYDMTEDVYLKITDKNAQFSLFVTMACLGARIVPNMSKGKITVYCNDKEFIFDLTKENLGWDIDSSRTDAVLRYDSYYDDIIIDGETAREIFDKIGATYTFDSTRSEIRINGLKVAKLFVNGFEIKSEEYAKINLVNTELPILLIMKNLGATIDIDDTQSVITVTYGEKVFEFNLSQKDFGWLIKPGALLSTRKFDGEELILDGDSASDIFKDIGATVKVDRETYTIQIYCVKQ